MAKKRGKSKNRAEKAIAEVSDTVDTRVRVVDLPGGRRARIMPESEDGKGGSSRTVVRSRVVGQMPHDDMRKRGQIDRSQYEAAEYMYANYVRAGLVPVKSQSMERLDCGEPFSSEQVAKAKEKYLADLALLEPRGASVVHNVCGEGVTCTVWAKKFGVTVQYAAERLRESLTTLAEKHGF